MLLIQNYHLTRPFNNILLYLLIIKFTISLEFVTLIIIQKCFDFGIKITAVTDK
jgi:hypothetical protein